MWRSTRRKRLRFRRQGHFMMVFGGLICLSAGTGLILATFGKGDSSAVAGVTLGGIFGLTGMILAFGRIGAVVDPEQQRVRRWWGLRVPFLLDLPVWWKSYALDRFRVVLLRQETWWQSQQGGGTTMFVVYLAEWLPELGASPSPSSEQVLVAAGRRYLWGRRAAEQVAKTLDLGMADEASGTGDRHYRPPGTLDDPYSWRAEWSEELLEMPQRPGSARSTYEVHAGEGVLRIPARRLNRAVSIVITGLMAIAVTFLVLGGVAYLWVLIPIGTVCLLLLVVAVLPALVRDTVRASPSGITVTRVSLLGRRTMAIGSEALEEVCIGRPLVVQVARIGTHWSKKVVSIRSDRRIIEVGLGLDDEELQWLHTTIRGHLLGIA